MSETGLRSLQIHGSLELKDESSYVMELTSDVLNGNYNPLRVTKDPTSEDPTTVTLLNDAYGVDLQLVLQRHLTDVRWITLLETDGIISGTFSTINGDAFGTDNHFVLTYGDIDYDFYLYYNYDLGGGMTGIVLYAIPEPTTVVLWTGFLLAGLIWLRSKRRR
jgi:hypothetical protein